MRWCRKEAVWVEGRGFGGGGVKGAALAKAAAPAAAAAEAVIAVAVVAGAGVGLMITLLGSCSQVAGDGDNFSSEEAAPSYSNRSMLKSFLDLTCVSVLRSKVRSRQTF